MSADGYSEGGRQARDGCSERASATPPSLPRSLLGQDHSMPRDLRSASISAISSSIGGSLFCPLRAPFLVGKALAVDSAVTALLLALGDRRAISPPPPHTTPHRPSNERPNHTAGDRMILEAQVPNATIASHSSLRRPLKYKAIGASAMPMPWITRPLFPLRHAIPVAITPSSVSPTHKGSNTVSTAGIIPMCHAHHGVAMGESTRLPRSWRN